MKKSLLLFFFFLFSSTFSVCQIYDSTLSEFKHEFKEADEDEWGDEIDISDSNIKSLYLNSGYENYPAVYFDESRIENGMMVGDFSLIESNESYFKKFDILGDQRKMLFEFDTIENLSIWGIQDTVQFHSAVFKRKLLIRNTTIKSFLEFSYCEFPDTILFTDLVLGTNVSEIVLPDDGRPRVIDISGNTTVDKIVFKYLNYTLYFSDKKLSFEDRYSTYTQLLDNYRKRAMSESYEKLDKEFKEFKHTQSGKWYGLIINWIDKHWWDYGYNKFLIIINAILLNLLFFIVNLLIRKRLMTEGYRLEKFLSIQSKINAQFPNEKGMKNRSLKAAYTFVYTCYIFWGWKLDIDKLSISNLWLFSYVMLQYLLGIVCLAYFANLIITE